MGITQKDLQNATMQIRDIEIPESQIIADLVIHEVVLDNGKTVRSSRKFMFKLYDQCTSHFSR